MKKLFWFLAIATAYEVIRGALQERESKDNRATTQEHHEGFTVTRTPVGRRDEVIRFRGGYDDIMRSLGVVKDDKPPVPSDLDIENLPKYWGGCPKCGAMSMVGENMWRYQELDRTRGYMNNTTTFLTKCKKCGTFMKSTVDHDD